MTVGNSRRLLEAKKKREKRNLECHIEMRRDNGSAGHRTGTDSDFRNETKLRPENQERIRGRRRQGLMDLKGETLTQAEMEVRR